MKNIFKNTSTYILILKIGLVSLVGVTLFIGILVFVERDKIAIDRYNFEQLSKAKPILESIPTNTRKFYTLKEFNQQYNANIQPIENCYYVSNDNGNEKYIFGFHVESIIYKIIYFGNTYAYPKYSMPYVSICIETCYDRNLYDYRYVKNKIFLS